jgi:hypothetical protein
LKEKKLNSTASVTDVGVELPRPWDQLDEYQDHVFLTSGTIRKCGEVIVSRSVYVPVDGGPLRPAWEKPIKISAKDTTNILPKLLILAVRE